MTRRIQLQDAIAIFRSHSELRQEGRSTLRGSRSDICLTLLIDGCAFLCSSSRLRRGISQETDGIFIVFLLLRVCLDFVH